MNAHASRPIVDPPTPDEIRAHVDARLLAVTEAVRTRGGRAFIVGGWVRDWLRGHPSKDVDVEVHGLRVAELEDVLSGFGEVQSVGRSFGVLRVRHLDVDFSIPRRDSKVGPGHRGIQADVDPDLHPTTAARRRDLTINSMMLDPIDGELLDPHGGRDDLVAGRLRATDPASFGEDPLRALRVVQFAARLEMQPDPELVELCRAQDLSELSGERIFDELRKLMLRAERPSIGLELLERTGLIRFFPELHAMVGVPQDPVWHPEGDVWIHTCMVVDEAAAMRTGDRDRDLALMFGALCHDLGKPDTTVEGEDGRIRSPRHDVSGVSLVHSLLGRMRAPLDLVARVEVLTQHHLAPMQFRRNKAGPKAYRRLARRMQRGGADLQLLERVARADHFGRTTEDALARQFPAGDLFLERARELEVDRDAPPDVVRGRHLLARGFRPGPEVGDILERCRDVQDATGWTDADRILERVLGEVS